MVIAIIALLASLLLPALKQVRLNAKGAACASNERQVGIAMTMYAGDWNSFVPVQAQGIWRSNLLAYATAPVFNCPASLWQVTKDDILTGDNANAGSLGQFYFLIAYNYSRYVPELNQVRSDNGAVAWWPIDAGWKNPSESIYVADAYFGNNAVTYPTTESTLAPWLGGTCGTSHIHAELVGTPTYFAAGQNVRRFADRHLGTNCLFVDGRVQRYSTRWLDSIPINDPQCLFDTQ